MTEAIGDNAHTQGELAIADSKNASAAGLKTQTDGVLGIFVVGKYGGPNEATLETPAQRQYGFYVAGGTSAARGLSAMILNNGRAYANTCNTGGTDYAELFESYGGLPIDAGYFVALAEDNKIRIANSSDFIIGIVSKTAGVLGNNPLHWKGKYLRDEWGAIILDENEEPVVNPQYDREQSYILRDARKQWVAVGLLGQLFVRDDSSCIVGQFCSVTDEGIATKADAGYLVLSRTADRIIKILYR